MTKKILTVTIALAAGFSTVPAKFQASNSNFYNSKVSAVKTLKTDDVKIGGKWSLTIQAPGQSMEVTLELNQEEKTFSGKMISMMGEGKVVNGKLNDKDFSAVIQANLQGQDMDIEMSGKIDGEKMTGTLFVPNMDGIPFEGKKSDK